MSSFTKLSNGNVIFTDNNGNESKLSPMLNVLPHPANQNDIIITPFVKHVPWSSFDMVVDWRQIQSPIVEDRNDAIEKLALNFFFSVNNSGEQHTHSNLLILEQISEIEGELAYKGLKLGHAGRVLFVSETGDDATAKKGSLTFTYRNTTAAKEAASIGDLIYVLPGVYNNCDSILKNGVNWYISPGAEINSVNSSIFNSLVNEPVTSSIYGGGKFHAKFATLNLRTGHNGSNIYLEGNSISSVTGYPIDCRSVSTVSVKMLGDIIGGNRALNFDSGIVASIQCRDIKVDNPINNACHTIATSNPGSIDLQCRYIFNELIYGSQTIVLTNGGAVKIRCQKIIDVRTQTDLWVYGHVIYHLGGTLDFSGDIESNLYPPYGNGWTGTAGKAILNGKFTCQKSPVIRLQRPSDVEFYGTGITVEANEAARVTIAGCKLRIFGSLENQKAGGNLIYNNQATTEITFSKAVLKAPGKIIDSTVAIPVKVIDYVSTNKQFESNISLITDFITIMPGLELPPMPELRRGKVVLSDSIEKENTVISFAKPFVSSDYALLFRVYDSTQEYFVDEKSRTASSFTIDLSHISFTSITVEYIAAL